MSPRTRKAETARRPERDRPSLDDRLEKRGLEIQGQAAFFRLEDYLHIIEALTIENVVKMQWEELRPSEERLLRRMMGLKLKQLKAEGVVIDKSTPSEQRFWEGVETWAKAEIDTAAGLADDLSDMPKSWQPALKSLTRLQGSLRTQRGEK